MQKGKWGDKKSQRDHMLDLRKRDDDEMIKDVEDQYHRDLEDVRDRANRKAKEEAIIASEDFKTRMHKRRMQSQSMFKDNLMRKGSFGDGSRDRSNVSHFDTTSKLYRDMPVED